MVPVLISNKNREEGKNKKHTFAKTGWSESCLNLVLLSDYLFSHIFLLSSVYDVLY